MKERLVELVKNAHDEQKYLTSDKSINAIVDYLLANGVIVPPCNARQTVYKFNGYNKTIIDECRIRFILHRKDGSLKINLIDLRYMNYFEILPDEIGKTVFLTREEAQAKLKEGGKG